MSPRTTRFGKLVIAEETQSGSFKVINEGPDGEGFTSLGEAEAALLDFVKGLVDKGEQPGVYELVRLAKTITPSVTVEVKL